MIVFVVCGLSTTSWARSNTTKNRNKSTPTTNSVAKVSPREPASLEKKVKEITKLIEKSGLKSSDMSLYAGDENFHFVDLNSSKKMIPASITKLVTAATTLVHFPPGTKFNTELWAEAPVKNGVLQGSLYLKGGGDPSFTSETMWFLVNEFHRTGITEIMGDIVVDDSLFDRLRFDPSRESERSERAYDAPTGAMSFNWNSVNVFVRPGDSVGSPGKVIIDPMNTYIQLRNDVKTVGKSAKTSLNVDRKALKEGDQIIVTGQISIDDSEQVVYRDISQPDFWSAHNLASFLKQRGIRVLGNVSTGVTPSEARMLARAPSKPIEQILADMNKFSNNYVAEMLAKNISLQRGKPGSIVNGIEVMKDYLSSIGLKKDEYVLVNPSGFTRENRFSAQGLWKVLHHMRDQFQYQPELTTSLPIAGIDGTLKKRMKNTPAERWVRAKTGLLNGVVSLAGYAGRSDGSIYPFVFMYNGPGDGAQVRQLFDRICIAMVEN